VSTKDKIRALVDAFVGDLDRLVREAVWETAQQSLGMSNVSASAPARAGGARAAAPAAPARAAKRSKGQKRNPADIARLTERLLQAIAAKPGQRMEQIRKGLGVDKAELLIPVARLVESKKIRRTGEKRATQYFPAK
jgi:hypothetical protein